MSSKIAIRAGLEQFRRLPEIEPPLEYYAGRITQKMSPRLSHSVIQGEMFLGLTTFIRPRKLGRVFMELRCTFGGSSIVPDLSYFREDRMPDPTSRVDRESVAFPPDLTIEIISPGQTVGELKKKIRAALRGGVQLGWLIDQDRRRAFVLRPGKKAEMLGPGDRLSGEGVIPGFLLAIDEMFGWLDGP